MIEKKCPTCGSLMRENRFKSMDCPHCNVENFAGFIVTKENTFKPVESQNIIDIPIFVEGQGIDVLAESES